MGYIMQHTVKGEHTEMLMDINTKTALQRSKHTHISRHTQALLSSKISLTRQLASCQTTLQTKHW